MTALCFTVSISEIRADKNNLSPRYWAKKKGLRMFYCHNRHRCISTEECDGCEHEPENNIIECAYADPGINNKRC
jgi:hypothetical protein